MSTVPACRLARKDPAVPPLVNGDRLTQAEFHRRYEACDEDEKFELVGGIVYMASPLGLPHSDYDEEIGTCLTLYRLCTPGVQVLRNATAILGEESEPQPDLGMRIRPEYGGQSGSQGKYLKGPPELVVEVAHSSVALAMHAKKADYRQAGVTEYLVVCVEDQEVHWFHFAGNRALRPDREGISRSRVFPGLWLDTAAILRLDSSRVRAVAERGLASNAHAAFVRRLQRQHRGRSRS